jgi:phosphoribosylformylglycinamidine synthase
VSFYNESRGADIDPTPVVAVVGIIDELDAPPPVARLVAGQRVVVLGATGPDFGGSEWAAVVHGLRGGVPPAADLRAAGALHELVRDLVASALVDGVHDCSDGGLAVALAEMAIGGDCGFRLAFPDPGPGRDALPEAAWCFGESTSRVVLSVAPELVGVVLERARRHGVPAADLGESGGRTLRIDGPAGTVLDIPLTDAARAWREAIPAAVGAEAGAELGFVAPG